MAALGISEARDTCPEIINRVAYQGERIGLRRHRKRVAALVSTSDVEQLVTFENRKMRRRGRRQS